MNVEETVFKHEGEIATLKSDVSTLKTQVEDLTSVRDAVIKLTTIEEKQDKRNEKIDEMFNRQIEVNAEVSGTLKGIDKNLNYLNTKVDTLEGKVESSNNRVEITKGKLLLYGTIITGVSLVASTVLPSLFK